MTFVLGKFLDLIDQNTDFFRSIKDDLNNKIYTADKEVASVFPKADICGPYNRVELLWWDLMHALKREGLGMDVLNLVWEQIGRPLGKEEHAAMLIYQFLLLMGKDAGPRQDVVRKVLGDEAKFEDMVKMAKGIPTPSVDAGLDAMVQNKVSVFYYLQLLYRCLDVKSYLGIWNRENVALLVESELITTVIPEPFVSQPYLKIPVHRLLDGEQLPEGREQVIKALKEPEMVKNKMFNSLFDDDRVMEVHVRKDPELWIKDTIEQVLSVAMPKRTKDEASQLPYLSDVSNGEVRFTVKDGRIVKAQATTRKRPSEA